MRRILTVAALALVFTFFFFHEYLSPFRFVHIPYDLDGFHYPLMDYGFQALKEGRFPQWDAATYSGISYVGNPQAALFYPPTWLMFAANWQRDHLSYQSMEWFVLAHVWLGFVLAYLWLTRGRRLAELPSLLGAGIFAFSGYACLQLQHQGLISGYAWFPLALLGVDQAAAQRRWQPLLKVAAASALCFLAGYTPGWFVFAAFVAAYALGSGWRAGVGTIGALGASLCVAMVQLLPTWYLTATKIHENRYGAGIRDWDFYLSYVIPNFFDFAMDRSPRLNFGREYLYLGVPAMFGIACLLRHRKGLRPILFALSLSLVMVTNPFELVSRFLAVFPLLEEVCRDWYFLAGLTVAASALAATGLDTFFKGAPIAPFRAAPVMARVSLLASLAWTAIQLVRWKSGSFATGWQSAFDPAITLVIFALCAWAWRRNPNPALAAALLLIAAADYKAFGTSKRFNAAPGSYKPVYSATSFPEMESPAYQEMRKHPEYRVATDITINPLMLRHAGLATPQGFDPFLPATYRADLELRGAKFRSNWEYSIDPEDFALLQMLGVRYVITAVPGPLFERVSTNSHFRPVAPSWRFHRVFEYLDARATYGWLPRVNSSTSFDDVVAPTSEIITWNPEHRAFMVNSLEGGRFALRENLLPGWTASVDGKTIPIEPLIGETFQAVIVPAGRHRLELAYRAKGLVTGAWISALSILTLLSALQVGRLRKPRDGS